MVAKIISGKSIRGILNYNEQKVTEGKAQLILASGFGGEIGQMNFANKIQRFEHLTILNEKVKTNALHISLNFDSGENLSTDKLQQIAMAYMDKIGFGDQPYLVYRHKDTSHHHVHIATTNIQADGKRIDIHNIGRLVSEPARKAIEQEFGLVKAESKQFKTRPGIKPAGIEKAAYGQIPTKRAVSNVVNAVVSSYKFTSLAELNAILKQFNVIADRGKEETQMFQKKGLIYSLIDEKGNAIGVPIKASSLYSKPTLTNLEKHFKKNEEERKPYKENLKTAIDKVFTGYQEITKDTFVKELAKLQINVVFRQNEQSFTYGVTFVDNQNKTVFNGSDLGEAYSAKALSERFGNQDKPNQQQQSKPNKASYLQQQKETSYLKPQKETDYLKTGQKEQEKTYLRPNLPERLLDNLLGKTDEDSLPTIPEDKKKKKRELHL